ncbi:hypothetical protein ES705_17142 [subsurface metagenome]|nr:PIN domain-containing protein [Methanosarcinales archaeon]
MKYLLDTKALIAFFNNEVGADFVERILGEIDENKAEGFVSAITLTEIYYLYYKIKAIPIADALIAASAHFVEAKVVTDDEHFEKLDVEVAKFRGMEK